PEGPPEACISTPCQKDTENKESAEKPPVIREKLIRPTYKRLYTFMVKGFCMMKKRTRKKLAGAIKKLDAVHMRFLEANGYSSESPKDVGKYIKGKTEFLPSGVTHCERGIAYGLRMQVDMLDTALADKDPENAALLKEKRSKKRRLKQSFKIYGDYRDVYFYMVLDRLKDVSKMHYYFGVQEKIELDFPVGLKKGEVEDYLVMKIELVAKRAEGLSFE
ncbi:MAG: hypothetical protein GY765_14690, partial [bacterium]|nr:hypothetical protein [bacterium]